ncbi:MAG: AmmeMemoRadiSam system radical SAM enzyme [Calditrichota bacterium]
MEQKNKINRRNFLSLLSSGGCLLLSSGLSSNLISSPTQKIAHQTEARWYEKQPYKKIICKLCPRECNIDDRERGYCGVRENWDGIYYTLVHSKPCTYHVDPIEKKPLFHFLPGTEALSIATVGCNVDCKFCQNWQISQVRPEQVKNFDLPPKKIAELAIETGAPSIAYTYSEPIIFAEYMYDTAVAGNERHIKSVMISNGYIQEKPMRELVTVLSAVKIDLKAFSEKYYQEIVDGELKPVLDTLVLLKKLGIWTEIVYLMVPTLNDSESEITKLSRWIKNNLGVDVPIHFTRFYPQYKMQNLPPTPTKTLETARQIALSEGIRFVYIGNIPGHEGENTYCPGCKNVLIEREGFYIKNNKIKQSKCKHCGMEIPGIWM